MFFFFLFYLQGKKRFELACYKNKLLEYRSGTETDLDNVLQVPTIFLSVSKAQTAPSAELAKAFGPKTPTDEIIQEILRKGEVQVGERERKEILERVEKEVLELVSSRLVDPSTKRVYTTGMIGKALDQLCQATNQQANTGKGKEMTTTNATKPAAETVTPDESQEQQQIDTEDETKRRKLPTWTGVVTNKSAKIQALDAIKALIAWQPIPVMRARMRLRVTCSTSILKQAVKSTPSAQSGDTRSQSKSSGNKKGKKAHDSEDEDTNNIQSSSRSGGGGGGGSGGTVKDRILSYVEQVESQDVLDDEWEVVGFADPGAYKGLGDFISADTKGKARVEVLDMAVTHDE